MRSRARSGTCFGCFFWARVWATAAGIVKRGVGEGLGSDGWRGWRLKEQLADLRLDVMGGRWIVVAVCTLEQSTGDGSG
jgi:hypothetical protein